MDDQPTKVYRTNHALIGCLVPAGTHKLELQMTAPMLRYGVLIAAAAGIIIAALMIGAGVGAHRQRGRVEDL